MALKMGVRKNVLKNTAFYNTCMVYQNNTKASLIYKDKYQLKVFYVT